MKFSVYSSTLNGEQINVKKAPFDGVQIKYIHLYTIYVYIIHISFYPILYVPRVCARIIANILSV